jgi:serine/threonine-protein kinase PpkA
VEDSIQIPGYTLEKPIGHGAMASVFLAIQHSLERRVALKLMAASLVADPTFRERFLKEGKIIGQLSHPHIITIYDIGIHETCYYMAMEYINGGTLKERIRRGISVDDAVEILRQIGAALGYAHKRGFVHRDVKPANILFRENDSAVLSDFGIAKAFNDGTQMTGTGWTVGTPNYMSPEQALGKTVDARSDLYGLGIVFYEMLTGEKPYQATDPFATALMHVNSPVPILPERLANYQAIMEGLLAKTPDDRYASAEVMLEVLKRLRGNGQSRVTEGDTVVLPSPPPGSPPAAPRFKAMAWALVLLIPLAGATAYFMSRQPPATPQPHPTAIQPQRPTIDEKTRRNIQELLRVADLHKAVGYLTFPPSTNAFEVYQRVLELDPYNEDAQKGLKTIADLCGAKTEAGDENACPGYRP